MTVREAVAGGVSARGVATRSADTFLLYGLESPRFRRGIGWLCAGLLLLVGVAAAWFPGTGSAGFPLLAWTVALVPLFLLLYYAGWRGMIVAFLGVVVAVVGFRVVALVAGARADVWTGLAEFFWTLAAVATASAVVLEAVRSLWRSGLADPVSGLPDRRLVEAFLAKEMAAAHRGRSLTIALLGLDGCRSYDDRCAHLDRDVILERVGRVLRANGREMDFIGRYGDDRFLAVMPGESSFGVSVFADRVREQVGDVPLPEPGGCTLSVGVASHEPSIAGTEELVRRAEDALTWARNLGGNRVLIYGRPAYREGPVRPSYQAESRPIV